MRSSLPPSSKRTSASEIVALYNRPVPRPLLSQQPLVNLKESLNPSHETKRLMPTRAETPQSREVSPTPPSSSIAPDEISESDSTFSVANKGVWSKDADALKSVRNRNDGRNGDKEVPGSRKEDDFLDGRVNASKGKHIAHSTAVATSSRTLGSTRPGFETHISGTPIEKSIVRGGRIDNVSSSVESRTVPDIHIERPHNSSRNHHGARQTDEITYAPGASPNTIITEDEDPSLYAIHSRTASAASSNISKTSSARSKRREKLADAQKARGTAIPIAIVPVSLMPEKTEQENVLKGRDDARPQNTSSCEITSVPEILTTASSSKGTRRTSPFSTARLKRRSKQASSSSDLNRWLKRKSASSDSQNDGIEPVELLKPAHLQTDQSEHIESALPQHQESTVNSLPPMPECERRHDTSSTQCVSSLVMSDNTAFTSSQVDDISVKAPGKHSDIPTSKNVEALLKSSARNVTDPIKGKAPAQKEVNGEREELPAGVPKLSSPRGLSLPRKKQLNRINASFNANQTSTPASLQAPAHFVNQPPRALLSPVSNGPDENSPEIDEYNGEDFEVVEVPSELPEYLSSESLDFVEEFLEDGQRQTRFDTNSEASFQEYDFEDHLDGNLSKTSQPNTTSSNYFETADYDDFDPNTFPLQVVQNDVSYEYEIDAPTDPLKDPDGPILNKPKHPWRPSSYQSGFMYHEHKPPIPYTSEYPHVTQDSKLHAKTPFATPVAKKLHQSHSLKMYSKQIQSHFDAKLITGRTASPLDSVLSKIKYPSKLDLSNKKVERWPMYMPGTRSFSNLPKNRVKKSSVSKKKQETLVERTKRMIRAEAKQRRRPRGNFGSKPSKFVSERKLPAWAPKYYLPEKKPEYVPPETAAKFLDQKAEQSGNNIHELESRIAQIERLQEITTGELRTPIQMEALIKLSRYWLGQGDFKEALRTASLAKSATKKMILADNASMFSRIKSAVRDNGPKTLNFVQMVRQKKYDALSAPIHNIEVATHLEATIDRLLNTIVDARVRQLGAQGLASRPTADGQDYIKLPRKYQASHEQALSEEYVVQKVAPAKSESPKMPRSRSNSQRPVADEKKNEFLRNRQKALEYADAVQFKLHKHIAKQAEMKVTSPPKTKVEFEDLKKQMSVDAECSHKLVQPQSEPNGVGVTKKGSKRNAGTASKEAASLKILETMNETVDRESTRHAEKVVHVKEKRLNGRVGKAEHEATQPNKTIPDTDPTKMEADSASRIEYKDEQLQKTLQPEYKVQTVTQPVHHEEKFAQSRYEYLPDPMIDSEGKENDFIASGGTRRSSNDVEDFDRLAEELFG